MLFGAILQRLGCLRRPDEKHTKPIAFGPILMLMRALYYLLATLMLIRTKIVGGVVEKFPVKAFFKAIELRESLKDMPYALIDCALHHRLEKFGPYYVKRPCPVAFRERRYIKEVWEDFDFSYELPDAGNQEETPTKTAAKGIWTAGLKVEGKFPQDKQWIYDAEHFHLRLDRYEAGQVGVFPEQKTNWKWLRKTLLDKLPQHQYGRNVEEVKPIRILNAFAYSGASTLSCLVHPSIQVTHLDASKTAISLAKENYNISLPLGITGSVRWIIDDCMTFLNREIKRKQSTEERYDGLIFDPPAFGRGADKAFWSLDRDLPILFDTLIPKLLSDDPKFILITCHDRKWTSQKLLQALRSSLSYFGDTGKYEHGDLALSAYKVPGFIRGNNLPLGSYVRWSR